MATPKQLDLGIRDRKGTVEPLVDIIWGATERDFFTALHAHDCNRVFGVQHFPTESEALDSFIDRDIRFRASRAELDAMEWEDE